MSALSNFLYVWLGVGFLFGLNSAYYLHDITEEEWYGGDEHMLFPYPKRPWVVILLMTTLMGLVNIYVWFKVRSMDKGD